MQNFLTKCALVLMLASCAPEFPQSNMVMDIGWAPLPARFFAAADSRVVSVPLDRINADLTYLTADGVLETERYLIPTYITIDDGIATRTPMFVTFEADAPGTVSGGHQIPVPGIRAGENISMIFEVFAVGYDKPVFKGSVGSLTVLEDQENVLDLVLEATIDLDADGDGYIPDEIEGGPDCNDNDADFFPGAPEVCDGLDHACNGAEDEAKLCLVTVGDVLMQRVPAGEYKIGDRTLQDEPKRAILVDEFLIDRYEVSVGEYHSCGTCAALPETHTVAGIQNYTRASGGFLSYPALYIHYAQAVSYCESLGKRLPTDLEWEIAARGLEPNTQYFPWGTEPGDFVEKGNVLGFFDSGPMPVKADELSASLSPFGVENMIGNAFEWTSQWYNESHYETIPSSQAVKPPLADKVDNRKVIKGGSWRTDPVLAMTVRRFAQSVTESNAETGFRCVQDVP